MGNRGEKTREGDLWACRALALNQEQVHLGFPETPLMTPLDDVCCVLELWSDCCCAFHHQETPL